VYFYYFVTVIYIDMTAKLLVRLAAACLLFFALGHSVGHSSRRNVSDPKAKEVLQAMSDNKFDMFGQMRSYDENYEGMSLNLIFTLLAFIFILWTISGSLDTNQALAQRLLVPIGLCVVGFAVTGFLYFFLVPAITCVAAAIFIFWSVAKSRG
jgi:hypothetical protein